MEDKSFLPKWLQRALKIARACPEANTKVSLYTDILNLYIYFYKNGSEDVSVDIINKIVEKIKEEMAEAEGDAW